MQRIVVVGGGAGGLELATKLGRKLGKKGLATIKLIDSNHTHLWKPLLHEVASGVLDSGIDELNYLGHGKRHGFNFHLGRMSGLDREQKRIILAPMLDDNQEEVLPERYVNYDLLVMALGSVTNDFGTQGASDHCYFLDSRYQAERFHTALVNSCLALNAVEEPMPLNVAIVGAGATGVELSAELRNTAEQVNAYGLKRFAPNDMNITLIEAGPRILPALPERIAAAAHRELEALGVNIKTNTMITEINEKALHTKDGSQIDASLKVWAAGVKAPAFLSAMGLETNRVNQLVVNSKMQTEDESIFAIGDCAQFIQEDGSRVPPRAQAAHQQATHMAKVIFALRENKPLPDFVYKDKGSLVSLSRYSTVGSLMGNLTRGSMKVEGRMARFVYVSLYRLHQVALHGYSHTLLLVLVGHINKVIRPALKLH